jgi:outer membrane lipoprotein SlyB
MNTFATKAQRAATPLRTAAVLALALGLTACASTQPVIYSKKSDSIVLGERAQRDLLQCTRLADERVGRNSLKGAKRMQTVAEKTASAGTIAFVAAALGSAAAQSKEAWERARGAAAAGVAGMATKLLLEINEGDEVYQQYVEICLEGRGHDVLGWR